MDKAVVNMSNWELYVYKGEYNLSGVADLHPKLGRNAYIATTSDLVRFTVDSDVLNYETRNTIYVCPFKYIRIKNIYHNVIDEYVRELANLYTHSDSWLDKIISALAQLKLDDLRFNLAVNIKEMALVGHVELDNIEKEEHDRLIREAEKYEDCIYFEVSSISNGSPISYNIDGNIGVVNPDIHSGTFQDSVLYTTELLDFRYFPNGSSIRTYSWSENIRRVVVRNTKGYTIQFNGVSVEPGVVHIFENTMSSKEILQYCEADVNMMINLYKSLGENNEM